MGRREIINTRGPGLAKQRRRRLVLLVIVLVVLAAAGVLAYLRTRHLVGAAPGRSAVAAAQLTRGVQRGGPRTGSG
jgi:hypothetical protein